MATRKSSSSEMVLQKTDLLAFCCFGRQLLKIIEAAIKKLPDERGVEVRIPEGLGGLLREIKRMDRGGNHLMPTGCD